MIKLLALNPGEHSVWNNRGCALAALKRLDEAIASYDRALTIRPDSYDAWNNRGAELYSLGLYQEALDSFDRAVALKNNEELYWSNRGNALRRLGQLENALVSYNTALSINRTYSQAQHWQSIVLRELERKNKVTSRTEPNEHEQTSEEEANRLAFHRALLASGLVRQIKQPSRYQQSERQLIQVQGKPISETIIGERR